MNLINLSKNKQILKISIMKHFNDWRVGRKLAFIFCAGTIVPLIFIQSISYGLNQKFMTTKMKELSSATLQQTAERASLTLDLYANILYQIYVDETISENITELMGEKTVGKAAAYNKISSRLKQYGLSSQDIRSISIVCADGNSITYDESTDSLLNTIWSGFGDMRNSRPYLEAVDQPNMVVTPTMKMEDHGEDTYLFHISKRLFDLNHLEKGTLGTAVMTIDADVLNQICMPEKEKGEEDRHGMVFILDKPGRVISFPEKMFMGVTLASGVDGSRLIQLSGMMKGKKMLLNTYSDPKTGWNFYYAYDQEYLVKDMKNSQRTFLLIGFAAILFAALLAVYMVKKMTREVRSVVAGMEQVKQGNLDAMVPVESRDEIGQMAENFNEMSSEVKRLVKEVTEADEKKKNAEIRALEAQINPHFLYNTLDSINWMAIESGEYEISTMLRNLGYILRYSINKSNQMASMKEIADWLDKYISLQKKRFNDGFEYRIHMEPGLADKRIYKLLLQPFVENAIIHGVGEMEYGGLLEVHMMNEISSDRICIIIEDNGKGMAKEMAAAFNDRKKAAADDGKSIGLYNAFSRMMMYYGDDVEWNVNSMEGMGTVITLKIPVRQEGINEDYHC